MSARRGHPSAARLQAFVMGELDAQEAQQLEEHLGGCAVCAEEVAAERELDEWVLRTAPPLGDGSADRALAALWERVDALAGERSEAEAAELPDAPTPSPSPLHAARSPRIRPASGPAHLRALPTPRRSASPLLRRAVAAALLLGFGLFAWWQPGAPGPRVAPEVELVAQVVAPVAPGAEPVPSDFDPERLQRVRERVATSLESSPSFPDDPMRFTAEAGEALAQLRKEGWPVDAHLRHLVFGDDAELARRALCYVASTGSGPSLVAEALRRRRHAVELLDWLVPGQAGVATSPSLIRRLGSRAREGDERALALLLAADSETVETEVAPIFERALDDLALSLDELRSLAQRFPARPVLAALVERPQRAHAAELFAEVAREHTQLASAALVAPLRRAADDDVRFEWAVAAQLDELVPELVRRMESAEDPIPASRHLKDLGSDRAIQALFVHVVERRVQGVPSGSSFGSWWYVGIVGKPARAEALGRAVAATHGEALLELAEDLVASTSTASRKAGPSVGRQAADALLLGALEGSPQGSDSHGRRAEWLVALARLGTHDAGLQLLARLEQLEPGDPIQPLMWATAGQLAGQDAQAQWLARGGDPRLLRRVSDAAAERFELALAPSSSLLRPLAQALHGTTPRNR